MVSIYVGFKLFLSDRETFCSDKTIGYYEKNITYFLNYLYDQYLFKPETSLDDVPADVFKYYIRYLRNKPKFENHPFANCSDKNIKNTTIRTYCRAVKAMLNFFNETFDTAFITTYKMPKDDSEEKVPLFNDEVDRIDSLFNLKTRTGLRNYCIVHLMLDAGLRSEDVETLRISDVMFDKNMIRVVGSKGEKSRIIYMCAKLKKALFSYAMLYRQYSDPVNQTKEYMNQPLLLQLKENIPINYNVIKQLFSRIKTAACVERLHPHLLRHTFATSFIMGGGNMEMLRLYLGHSDYTVTKDYLHIANMYKMMGADVYRLDSGFFKSIY